MDRFNQLTFITLVIGILFIFYGWTQTWDYVSDSADIGIYIARRIRSYVFIVGGIILLIISYLFSVLKKYIGSLELTLYERTIKREKEN